MKKFLTLFAFSGLLLISCSDDDNAPVVSTPPPVEIVSGSADFSNYVSIGNSLTAGFSDSALFIDGQTASYPNMLATNFALAGGGTFNIPFMADNLGGATLGGTPILGNRLFLSFASGSPTPTPVQGAGTTEISNVLSGPFNNMGVPGARSFDLAFPGYGSVANVALGLANPYYARFASAPNASVIQDALAQNPSFFTLWIGNNDVLGFATSGGAGIDHNQIPENLDPSTYAGNDISNTNVVASFANDYLAALTANGAGGAIANIPDVTTLPFFTTVPFNPIPLDAATANAVNSNPLFLQYNGGLLLAQQAGLITAEEVAQRTLAFQEGPNAMLMIDEDLTDLSVSVGLPNFRQTTADDLIVFTAQTIIGTLADPSDPNSVNGVGVPLADNWVLTPEEQEATVNATNAINQVIADLAVQYDLALVDANSFLTAFAEDGFPLADGSTVTATYATGGGFSLDGVHPSPRGYALIANLFTDAINERYGSNLPQVNPLDFIGLYVN